MYVSAVAIAASAFAAVSMYNKCTCFPTDMMGISRARGGITIRTVGHRDRPNAPEFCL